MAASVIKNDDDKSGVTAFWQEIRQMFDEKYPECVLISEWSHPSVAVNAGFHIDFLIHCNLPCYTKLFRAEKGRNVNSDFLGRSFFAPEGNGSIEDFLQDYLREYEASKEKGYISIPTGNHDLPRISYQRSKKELEVAYAFILTMPGVPFVSYGDEIGMKYFPEMPSKEGGFNRTGSRTPMQWTPGKNAGFSACDAQKLYLPVEENGVNVEEQLKDENSLLHTTRMLIGLRKQSTALSADGEIEFLNRKNNGYPLVYARRSAGEEYLVCINPTEKKQSFSYDYDLYEVVAANDTVAVNENELEIIPFSYIIWRKK